jgi:hypothetical protein
MNLRLVAIYLDPSQFEYILSINQGFLQENFNFKFEYYDSESDFSKRHQVNSYPTFFLLKNNSIANIIEGKIPFPELKERISSINYVCKL